MADSPRPCPACKTGTGLPRAVSTIKDRTDAVMVKRVCQSCGHAWEMEHRSPSMDFNPQPPANEKAS